MNKKLLAVMLSGVVSVSAFAAQPAPIGQGTVLKSIRGVFPTETDKAICQYTPGKGKRLQAMTCNFLAKGEAENAAGDNVYHRVTVTTNMPSPNFNDKSFIRTADLSANTMVHERMGLCDKVDYEGDKDGSFTLEIGDCHTKTKSSNSAVKNEDIDITITGDAVKKVEKIPFQAAVGEFKTDIEDHDSTPHTKAVKSYAHYSMAKRSISETNLEKSKYKLAHFEDGRVYKAVK